MAQKQLRAPALVTRNALGNVISSAARDTREFSARSDLDQGRFAVAMLARRYGLHPATALAHVEAFGFGGGR